MWKAFREGLTPADLWDLKVKFLKKSVTIAYIFAHSSIIKCTLLIRTLIRQSQMLED